MCKLRTLLLALLFASIGNITAFAVEVPASVLSNMMTPPSVKTVEVEPPRPLSAAASKIFGGQLFTGNFRAEQFPGFNPNYQISIGDRITIRVWGAVTIDGIFPVDPQGNIFVPSLGPVPVLGVRNGELNAVIQSRAQKVFRDNVSIYATLDATQPVKVFVTGFVSNPGLYAGLSSDSLLYYLDKAGGVDPVRGSYIDIKIMRNQSVRASVNLYDFLLSGKLELIQLNDGDTIIVEPRKQSVTISGEVLNPYIFEYDQSSLTVADLLKLAAVKPSATHVSVVRRTGREKTSEYYEIAKAQQIVLDDGDEVRVLADRYSGTILVRVEGAHVGEHALVLPYGATLQQVFEKISPSSSSNLEAIQLFRRSVAERQKEMINTSLAALESQALTARSATLEEATLRGKEADLILKFVERARNVEPKGQVILAGSQKVLAETILEDGDSIVIPEKNSLLLVHGEVMFPNAIVHTPGATPEFYIKQAGGYAQNADNSRILLFKTNGVVLNIPTDYKEIVAGDELMVLPKVDVKRLEIAKGFSQILYQVAIATRSLLLW